MIKSIKLIDIVKKLTKWDKKQMIFQNGINNAYPEKSDRLINNSVTAKTASQIMTQFIIGKGFGEVDNVVINKDKNLNVADFSSNVAEDITNNRGVFIHFDIELQIDLKYKYKNPKVIPFDWCRVGKKDDEDYNGKILIKRDWRDSKSKAREVDVFNNNKSVIDAQIKKAGSPSKYQGQIYYFNSDNRFHYPLSRIDAVMEDCDSEYQSSVYKNTLLRKGFFGKTLIVHRPLIDKTIPEHLEDGTLNGDYLAQESEAERVTEELEDFIGSKNAGGAMVVEMDYAGDNLDDAILFKNIETNLDPDLFQNVETSIRENILIAFNNIPSDLVKSSTGIFGNSGEALKEMKKSYWENTSKERSKFEMIINFAYNLVKEDEQKLNVIPLIDEEINNISAEQESLKAQATLRGSVGGVTALVNSIVTGVSQGLLTFDAGVAIIVNIYGFSEEQAKEMIGSPVRQLLPNTKT